MTVAAFSGVQTERRGVAGPVKGKLAGCVSPAGLLILEDGYSIRPSPRRQRRD
jgi:hypothetical protein